MSEFTKGVRQIAAFVLLVWLSVATVLGAIWVLHLQGEVDELKHEVDEIHHWAEKWNRLEEQHDHEH